MEASDLAIRMIEFAESRPLNTPQRSAADSPATQMLTPPGAPAAVATPITAAATSSSAVPSGIAAADSAESLPAPAVAEEAAPDYGTVPEAPSDSDPEAIKVSIKLASGKGIVRKYRAADPVRALFAVVAAEMRASGEDGDSAGRFDLMTRFPTLNLATCMDSSLGECNLAGVNVFVKPL